MAKKVISKSRKVRFNPKNIAVKISNSGKLIEVDNKAIYEEDINTFGIKKIKNKFIIYELRRKQKPLRRKTIKARKKERITDIVNRIQSNDIKIRQKYITPIYDGKSIQTNYKANIRSSTSKRDDSKGNERVLQSPQLMCVVQIYDSRREIIDTFIGYSQRFKGFSITPHIIKAREQVISMAIGKFIEVYGKAKKSGDLEAQIIELRYIYYKK